MQPVVFVYAVGKVGDVRRRLARLFKQHPAAVLVVDAADQRDVPLRRRPAWRRLTRRPSPANLVRGRWPQGAALPGATIIVPNVEALGPIWRVTDGSLARALRHRLTIRVLETRGGEPIELAPDLDPGQLHRLEAEAWRIFSAFHRACTIKGIAFRKRRGLRIGRPCFDWPVENGRLIPNSTDLETIREVCRLHADLGWPLIAIAKEFALSKRTLASGRPWKLPLVSAAYKFGVSQGWAPAKRRPWDFRKGRLSRRA